MEIYPEQFPEKEPIPGPRTASLTPFKTATDQAPPTTSGSRTPRRRKWTSPYGCRAWAASTWRSRASGSHLRWAAGPGNHERPLGQTLPFAPDLGCSHVPPRKHPDILGDSRCPVIAARQRSAVSPTWSRPGRCRRGQQSNVHLRWGTDRPMDRLAESLPARTAVPQYRSLGPRRRSRWATPPGRNFPFPTTDRPHVPPPQPIGHGRPDQRPRGRPRPSHQSPLPRHPDRWDQRPRVRR